MRLLPYEAQARIRLSKSAYKWIMWYFFKYLLDIVVQPEYFLVARLVFWEGKKFNTVLRLCEFDNLFTMYTIPWILMFFPKKDLSAVYADDRIKARKERLQFWYIISTFLLNFFQKYMILMLATNGSQYKLFHPASRTVLTGFSNYQHKQFFVLRWTSRLGNIK